MVGLETAWPADKAMMFRTDNPPPLFRCGYSSPGGCGQFYEITVTGLENGVGYGAAWTYVDGGGQ